MKKRIFSVLLVAFVLLCNLTVSFAAPADDVSAVAVKSAEYIKENGVISLVIANVSQNNITDSMVTLEAAGSEVIFTSGETAATGAIDAGKEVTVNFPVSASEKDLKNLKCEVLYILKEGTITAGDTFTQEDIQKFVVEDVLTAEVPTAMESVMNFLKQTGFVMLVSNWKCLIMILIA